MLTDQQTIDAALAFIAEAAATRRADGKSNPIAHGQRNRAVPPGSLTTAGKCQLTGHARRTGTAQGGRQAPAVVDRRAAMVNRQLTSPELGTTATSPPWAPAPGPPRVVTSTASRRSKTVPSIGSTPVLR